MANSRYMVYLILHGPGLIAGEKGGRGVEEAGRKGIKKGGGR